MYKILLCHRRLPAVGYRTWHDHWLGRRSEIVAQLRESLGYVRYAQTHQLPRRNLLYRGIRASRNWFVGAFLAAKQARQVGPPNLDFQTRIEERWDVVDEFWYASRAELLGTLTSPAGIAAGKLLADDHRQHVRRTAVSICEEFVVRAESPLPGSRINTLFCLRHPPGMSRAKMLDYWATGHKELVNSLQPALGFRAYDQLHVRSDAELSAVVTALGGNAGDEFDGIAALAYRNHAQLVAGFLSPRTQLANLKLVQDETKFIDATRSALVFGRQYLLQT